MRRLSNRISLKKIKGTKGFDDLSDIEAAMLAMALDTDGCLSAANNEDYYYPIFVFGGSSILPLELARKYGETAFKTNPKKTDKESFPYTWQISRQAILKKFLLLIRPYVILKWKQVDIALEMLEVLDTKPEKWKSKMIDLGLSLREANEDYKNPDVDIKEYIELGYTDHIRNEIIPWF